jgi:tripartite-type tricarboxylate transporter receptor subunit TctC
MAAERRGRHGKSIVSFYRIRLAVRAHATRARRGARGRRLSEPDVREKFNQTGNFAVTSTPEEFAAFIRNEAARWEKVLKEANIRYD